MTRGTLKLPPRVAASAQRKPPTSRARRAQHGRTPSIAADPIARTSAAPPSLTVHENPRLSKRMSELGLCSRREADEWIENGWVSVDGAIVTTLGTRVRPDAHITIDSAARRYQSQQVTILLNKPIGYVSGQAEDGYQP